MLFYTSEWCEIELCVKNLSTNFFFQQQPVMLADSSIIHTQFHQPHVLVPANPYLHEGKGKKLLT